MGFCTWCQLETESSDSCEWCKRPIRRNAGLYDYGAVALLREDHGDSADRATTLFGALFGLAFIALIGFIVMAGRNSVDSVDPLSQIAESEKTWTAERAASPAPVAANVPKPPVAATATLPTAPRSASRGPIAAKSPTPSLAGSARSTAAVLVDGQFGGSVPTTGLVCEQADVSVVRTKDGRLAIKGQVRVTNVTGARLSDITIRLVSGSQEVLLDLGDQDTDLGNGSARTFTVRALEVPEGIQSGVDPHLVVEATGPDGPYQARIALG